MTPKQYLKIKSKAEIAALCAAAQCAEETFRKIASTQQASYKLAKRIEQASGGVISAMEVLEPERFEVAR